MQPTFVFDIETIPDINAGRRLYQLEGLSDQDVVAAMQALRRQKTGGSDFIALHMQQIVAISVVLRAGEHVKVWSIGTPESTEAELITRFFSGIQQYTPILISWNGTGFDLPVLHYRALLHGVSAPQYWENGERDNQFRYNNYLSRYHYRHIDLMDILSAFQAKAYAPLDEIAVLLGFPGKMGMDGGQVWEHVLKGGIVDVRNYCETDVLNTYLVYLRFQQMRGLISAATLETEYELLKQCLLNGNKPHLSAFLEKWGNQ